MSHLRVRSCGSQAAIPPSTASVAPVMYGVLLDDRGFIRTGANVDATERIPVPMVTNVEGIFAIGDVRSASVKRVGAAIGEGAAVVAQLHSFLAQRGSARR